MSYMGKIDTSGEEAIVEKPQVKNPPHRPSSYTQEMADRICEGLALGNSLRTVCKVDDMPAIRTVFYWLRIHEDFLHQYTRAKEESADAMADEVLDISDDGSNDWMEIHRGDYQGWQVNGEALQRSKLRVETRKWLMAKMKPKKYGEKIDIDNRSEVTHRFQTLDDDKLDEAIKRAALDSQLLTENTIRDITPAEESA